MKIFLDTADVSEIKRCWSTGLIDGITTNPTLIRKSGRNHEEVYQEIKDIGLNDISMEVMGFLLRQVLSMSHHLLEELMTIPLVVYV